MNKTLRKAMISTIAMLVVGVMSLTGVTYAWFTAAGDASITGIEATVDSVDGGVLISTGSDVWASNISLGATPTFTPVSSAGALANDNSNGINAMQFFSATVSDTNSANITTAAATTGFFTTTLYLKNITGADLTVDLTNTEIVDTAKNAHFASRLAIVVEDRSTTSFDLAKDGLTEADGAAVPGTQFSRDVKIYEPYAKNHTRGAQNLYGALSTEETARTYNAVNKAATDFPWAAATNDALTSMGGTVKYNANEMTISVADTEIVKVTIYVWLEGQDIDCENTIAADSMKINLYFTKQENAQG